MMSFDGHRVARRVARVFAALVLAAPALGCACEMTVGWEPWPPYQFETDDGGVGGLDGELVSAILGRLGCTIVWQATTWKRQLEGVEAGTIDAVMSASRTPEREEWGWFSDPYRQSANHLVVGAGLAGRYPSLETFFADGKTLGVMKDYHYGDAVMAMLGDPAYAGQVRSTLAAEANMKMLTTGRVDGVLMDVFVASSLKRQLDVDDEVAAESLEVSTDDLHILFSKVTVDEARLRRFNEVLADLERDGTIQGIVERYSN